MSEQLRNVPVPDELAATRERIRVLQEHEAELRSLLIREPELRTGNSFAAEIQEVTTDRVDLKELRKGYPDIVSQFTFPIKTSRIMLREISEDGELLPFRRKAPA